MGDIPQILFPRPDLCSPTGFSSDWAKQTRRVFLGAPFPAHQRGSRASCETPPVCCLQNVVHLPSWFIKQTRVLLVRDGWGQRVPAQIKGSRLRRAFGRGDNGARLPLPIGARIAPDLLRVFLDAAPGTVRGVTCPCAWLGSGCLGGRIGCSSWRSRRRGVLCCF